MRTNLEHSNLTRPRITGLSFANVITTLAGTFVVPPDGPSVYVLDAGASNRTVRLPPRQYENQVVVANGGAANNLNVTDSSGVAQVTLPPQSAAIFFAASTRWAWVFSNFSAASDIVPSIYNSSGITLATDAKIQTTQVGAIVLTLPSAASWAAVNKHGNPLTIFDTTGNASVNPVTINPNGAETFSGQAQLVISTDYGGFSLEPIVGGGGWIAQGI